MSFVQMRTVPGLFIGRRTVLAAEAIEAGDATQGYRCGACDSVLMTAANDIDWRDVVVKCNCGEINQI